MKARLVRLRGVCRWRVASDHDFNLRLPAGPNGLPRTSVMPTVHQHGVVSPPLNDPLNFGRVKPAKPTLMPRTGHVLQNLNLGYGFKQRHIPIELHAESSVRLIPRRRLVAIVNVKIQLWTGSQSPKPRGVILNGMGTQDSKSPSLQTHNF